MMTPACTRRASGTVSATRAAPMPHSPPMPRPASVRNTINWPMFAAAAHSAVPHAYSAMVANNAVLANGATRYPNVVVADWATLAAQNPQWFGADGTHLAIDGPGASALASLIASTLSTG